MRHFMIYFLFAVISFGVFAPQGGAQDVGDTSVYEEYEAEKAAEEKAKKEEVVKKGEKEKQAQITKAAEKDVKPVKETPITQWRAKETALVESLDDEAKVTYFILRNKQGVIRAIRMAKRDIGRAVQECGQSNPNMQDTMTQRFDQWKGAVDPLLKTADAFLKQEIKNQTIVKRKTFNAMVELNDEAFEYQDSLADKEYVTSKGACEKLISSMDNTEEDMLRLMQEVLLPESFIRERG